MLTLLSVRIDVDELMSEKAEQDRKFQAENELVRVIQRERGAKGGKNALDHDGVTPRKRMWTEIADGESDEASSLEADVIDVWPSVLVKGMKQNKPRISLSVKPKAGVVKEIPSYPCVFCPSLDVDDLLLVLEPSEDVVARSQSRGGLVLAHLSCVNSIPEVWIEDRLVGEQTIPVVMGVNGITKDRWNLVTTCL